MYCTCTAFVTKGCLPTHVTKTEKPCNGADMQTYSLNTKCSLSDIQIAMLPCMVLCSYVAMHVYAAILPCMLLCSYVARHVVLQQCCHACCYAAMLPCMLFCSNVAMDGVLQQCCHATELHCIHVACRLQQ